MATEDGPQPKQERSASNDSAEQLGNNNRRERLMSVGTISIESWMHKVHWKKNITFGSKANRRWVTLNKYQLEVRKEVHSKTPTWSQCVLNVCRIDYPSRNKYCKKPDLAIDITMFKNSAQKDRKRYRLTLQQLDASDVRSKRLLEVLRNICPAIKCGSMMLKPDLTSTAMVPRFCIFNPPKLHFYSNENKTEPTRPCMNIEKCKVKKQSTGENLFTITDELGTTTHLMPVPAEYMKKWGWKDHVQVAEGRRSNEIARIICSWKNSAYDKVVDPQEVKYMRFKIGKENHIGFGLVLRQLPGDVS